MSDSLLRHRAFMRFWFARLAGTAANQMLMVAIGWQMYELTASAWDLGLVGLMQFLPSLALVLVAGHALDRYHRARILAACMALQAIVALLLMLGAWHGFASRTLLLGLSIAIGAAKAFQLPAQQSITPLLVPAAVLPRALAFSSAGMQAAIIAGPATPSGRRSPVPTRTAKDRPSTRWKNRSSVRAPFPARPSNTTSSSARSAITKAKALAVPIGSSSDRKACGTSSAKIGVIGSGRTPSAWSSR